MALDASYSMKELAEQTNDPPTKILSNIFKHFEEGTIKKTTKIQGLTASITRKRNNNSSFLCYI
jgi:hypothetical protein